MNNYRKYFPYLILLVIITIGCKKEVQLNEQLYYGSFVDERDGLSYKTIEIGNQVWMAENLRYFPDYFGEPIECVYGPLYLHSFEKSCPDGWHVPRIEEWQELISYLGGKEVAGGKMKEVGNDLWKSPNTKASNSSGFTALPAGTYSYYQGIKNRKEKACFWGLNIDIENDKEVYIYTNISLSYNSEDVSITDNVLLDYENGGSSVRCLKD